MELLPEVVYMPSLTLHKSNETEFEIIQPPTKLPTRWDKGRELDWVFCLKEDRYWHTKRHSPLLFSMPSLIFDVRLLNAFYVLSSAPDPFHL